MFNPHFAIILVFLLYNTFTPNATSGSQKLNTRFFYDTDRVGTGTVVYI